MQHLSINSRKTKDKTNQLVQRITSTNLIGVYVDSNIEKQSLANKQSNAYLDLQGRSKRPNTQSNALFINFNEYNRIQKLNAQSPKPGKMKSKTEMNFSTSEIGNSNPKKFMLKKLQLGQTQSFQLWKDPTKSIILKHSINQSDSPMPERIKTHRNVSETRNLTEPSEKVPKTRSNKLAKLMKQNSSPQQPKTKTAMQMSRKLEDRQALFQESDEEMQNPIIRYEEKPNDPFNLYYKTDPSIVADYIEMYNHNLEKHNHSIQRSIQAINRSGGFADSILLQHSQQQIEQPAIPSLNYNLAKTYHNQKETLPRRFNIPKKISGPVDLNLQNYFVGPKHAQILGQLLQDRGDMVRSINLQNANLNKKTCSDLLTRIKQAPQQLNLAKNKIGGQNCTLIGSFMANRKQNIKELNLEGSKIGNKAAIELIQHLNDNRSVKVLNLSDNDLDDFFAKAMKKTLELNDNLEELYLHWNNLKSLGGAYILEGVTTRDWVKVLDLSWNKIGSGQPVFKIDVKGAGLDLICKCLTKQKKSIVHLDLSFNHFNLRESQILQQAVKENKSLVGFHFEGNYGYVDIQGFLQIPEDFKEYAKLTLRPPHRIVGSKPQRKNTKHQITSNSKYRDNCWICDNWQEQEFTWPIIKNKEYLVETILIHLSFENFKGVEIECNKQLTHYGLTRMCPPGRVWFFFTINREYQISNLYNVGIWPDGIIRNVQIGSKTIEQVVLSELNYIDIQTNRQLLDDDYDVMFDIEPRVDDKMFEYSDNDCNTEEMESNNKKMNNSSSESGQRSPVKERFVKNHLGVVSKWKLRNSIFRDYRRDSSQVLKQAFEFDWKNCKLPLLKHIFQDSDDFKETLSSYFLQLKDLFRYLSAFSVQNNIYVISANNFQDFLQCFNILHPQHLKSQSVELRIIETMKYEQLQTNSSPLISQPATQISQQNPVIYSQIQNAKVVYSQIWKGLSRRGFLECFVRVIHERYVKSGEHKNISRALEDVMENNILPAFKGFECDTWRFRRYWNHQCERVVRKHWLVFQQLYLRFSGSKIKSFTPYKCLFLEEFQQMIFEAGLLGKISEREINLSYSCAMTTCSNEIDSDRYLYLNFIEFIEAFARVADRLSLPPVNSRSDIKNIINCQFLPLCFKLESLVVQVSGSLLGSVYEASSPGTKDRMNNFGLSFEKYYEAMNEQLCWRKLSKYAERKAKRIMDKQNDSLFKSKLVKSINLEVLYDDGMGIFKDTKQEKLAQRGSMVSNDGQSQISFDEMPDYEPSF